MCSESWLKGEIHGWDSNERPKVGALESWSPGAPSLESGIERVGERALRPWRPGKVTGREGRKVERLKGGLKTTGPSGPRFLFSPTCGFRPPSATLSCPRKVRRPRAHSKASVTEFKSFPVSDYKTLPGFRSGSSRNFSALLLAPSFYYRCGKQLFRGIPTKGTFQQDRFG